MPGASPPLVRTAIFFKMAILTARWPSRLRGLREDARRCQDCPLWANATQTVFGAGDPHARVMLVGEQPGDEEDRKGLPFVGPAGRLLDRALEAAGRGSRASVRHQRGEAFKWQLRGKRRLHKTPAQREIDACHQWLEREIETIKPQVIVALGSTAAQAVICKRLQGLGAARAVRRQPARAVRVRHLSSLGAAAAAGRRGARGRVQAIGQGSWLIQKALALTSGHSIAAPRTPLASPCIARTIGVRGSRW